MSACDEQTAFGVYRAYTCCTSGAHASFLCTGVREDAPPGAPKTAKYALGWGEVTVDWAPEPGDHSYRIQHNESCPCNVLAAERFRVRDYDKYRRHSSDEALRKLAAELYKSFSSKPAQSWASVWPVNHEGNQRSLAGLRQNRVRGTTLVQARTVPRLPSAASE